MCVLVAMHIPFSKNEKILKSCFPRINSLTTNSQAPEILEEMQWHHHVVQPQHHSRRRSPQPEKNSKKPQKKKTDANFAKSSLAPGHPKNISSASSSST